MGRITVFTINSCRHCKRVKAALNTRDIPFVEISLTTHPEKRSDMQALSEKLTVPQIFFNEESIGGADETISILEKWDDEIMKQGSSSSSTDTELTSATNPLQYYQQTIQIKPDPMDPRLQPPPTTMNESSSSFSPFLLPNDEFTLPNGQGQSDKNDDETQPKTISYAELYQTLLRILPQNTKYYLGVSHKYCFTGKQAIDAIVSHYTTIPSEADAIDFFNTIQQSQMIAPVFTIKPNTATDTYFDGGTYYRLQSFFKPNLLNTMRIVSTSKGKDSVATEDANELVLQLKQMLDQIQTDATDQHGNMNYIQASQSLLYFQFQEATCQLQNINMLHLDPSSSRLAFGINVYNIMIIHAFLQVGIPDTMPQRGAFFTHVGYNIGGHIFSFNELEHGILRGNRRPPYSLSRPFSTKDPRYEMIIDTIDPRIHFALNCGAKSCPPIETFTSQAIQEELQIASEAFHESNDNTFVNESKHKIKLSMIMHWYLHDFVSSKSQLPNYLLPFLRGDKKDALKRMIHGDTDNNDDHDSGTKHSIKVKYFSYDWSTNASEMKVFHNEDLAVRTRSISSLLKF